MLSTVQDALQLLVEKQPDDPLLFLSEQYPLYHSLNSLIIFLNTMYYISFDKLTHPSVDPVQRTISLLQNYSVDDGDPTDIIYESFTLLTKGGSTTLISCTYKIGFCEYCTVAQVLYARLISKIDSFEFTKIY